MDVAGRAGGCIMRADCCQDARQRLRRAPCTSTGRRGAPASATGIASAQVCWGPRTPAVEGSSSAGASHGNAPL